jgi:two-component system response regulator
MKQRNEAKPFELLLIEDNLGDVRLTMEALKECSRKINLHLIENGLEALHYLRKENNYRESPTPDLILLDLNLPTKKGWEILAEIKQDISLKRIPIVILSISSAEEDIVNAYENQANCYIIKPLDLDQFLKKIVNIIEFWSSNVRLP